MERISGYENVDHVLEVLAEFHRQLARAFVTLGERSSDERGQLALNYLAQHHRKRADALKSYQEHAPQSLRSNWFQVPFPKDPGTFVGSLDTSQQLDLDQVNDLLLRIDAFVSEFLQHMESRAETTNVKSLFRDLLTIDERERLLRSRALASFSQI